jgi:hypothetical protein
MQRRLVAIGLLVLAVPMAWLAWGFARDMRAHEQRIAREVACSTPLAAPSKSPRPARSMTRRCWSSMEAAADSTKVSHLGSDYAARSYRVIAPSRFGLVFGCHLADFLIEEGKWSGADFGRGPR